MLDSIRRTKLSIKEECDDGFEPPTAASKSCGGTIHALGTRRGSFLDDLRDDCCGILQLIENFFRLAQFRDDSEAFMSFYA